MIKRLALVICLVASLAGCERPLKVTLDGKNPPTFRFDGSGDVQRIAICEITAEGKLPPYGSGFWVLFPRGNVKASKSPPITYGVVPDGFYQTFPPAAAHRHYKQVKSMPLARRPEKHREAMFGYDS